jgi:hypothetical protein
MQRAINDGANYYTIGYSPIDKKMDGSYRQINVKLANGKYKLAYRNGYNADDSPAVAAKAGTNPLGPLLIFGMPAATGVLYGAHVVAATPQPAAATERTGQNSALQGPLTRYNVALIIRAQDVVLQPNPQGGRSGKILIGVKAYDHQGNAVNWAGDEETLTMGNADYDAIQKTGISAHLEIDLPSGTDLSLQTAVYDWGTGRAGTLNIPLTSPGAADTSAQEPRKAKSDGTQIP